jgi:ATP-dependent DNA ligase
MKPQKLELIWAGVIAVVAMGALAYLGRYFFGFWPEVLFSDGEAVVQDGNGASDFAALGSALRQRPHSIILSGFDLLHLDGKDLRQQTLIERRTSLKGLLGTNEAKSHSV